MFAKLSLASLTPAAQIVTGKEIRSAATDAPVERIEFMVPKEKAEAEEALAKRFFNRPEEHRYADLSSANWQAKWQLFSESLVAKASRQGFNAKSLEVCMRALNRGRNLQTAWWPLKEELPLDLEKYSKAEIETFERNAEEKYQLALKEREKNPEPYFNNEMAIVPVGAYLGHYADGDCWIIVCKWEMFPGDEPHSLGHIMVWALDAKTAAVVGYVSCD